MERDRLDPTFDSDRDHAKVPPESGAASSNVVGRPVDDTAAGFSETTETPAQERQAFSDERALDDGGSFDGLGVPVAET